MNHFKAFIAGLIVPAIILPFALIFALMAGNQKFLGIFPLHMLPLIWGVWNILYFAICRDLLPGSVNVRLLLTGGILGLIVACIGVFVLGVPEIIGIPHPYQFYPLIVAPIVYALLWRYFVKELNTLFGLQS